ncbi:MAG: hypothetical protein Q4C55_00200 [Eubacterium sp.]|nr:hypothetical protein [Eubacterium sp.]
MGTFEMRLRDYQRLGRKEGINTEKRQTAKKLLEAGQTIGFISQITGMTAKEILEIQEDLKKNEG